MNPKAPDIGDVTSVSDASLDNLADGDRTPEWLRMGSRRERKIRAAYRLMCAVGLPVGLLDDLRRLWGPRLDVVVASAARDIVDVVDGLTKRAALHGAISGSAPSDRPSPEGDAT